MGIERGFSSDKKISYKEAEDVRKDRITQEVVSVLSAINDRTKYDFDLVNAAVEREIGIIKVGGLVYHPVKPETEQVKRIVAEIQELQKIRSDYNNKLK